MPSMPGWRRARRPPPRSDGPRGAARESRRGELRLPHRRGVTERAAPFPPEARREPRCRHGCGGQRRSTVGTVAGRGCRRAALAARPGVGRGGGGGGAVPARTGCDRQRRERPHQDRLDGDRGAEPVAAAVRQPAPDRGRARPARPRRPLGRGAGARRRPRAPDHRRPRPRTAGAAGRRAGGERGRRAVGSPRAVHHGGDLPLLRSGDDVRAAGRTRARARPRRPHPRRRRPDRRDRCGARAGRAVAWDPGCPARDHRRHAAPDPVRGRTLAAVADGAARDAGVGRDGVPGGRRRRRLVRPRHGSRAPAGGRAADPRPGARHRHGLLRLPAGGDPPPPRHRRAAA